MIESTRGLGILDFIRRKWRGSTQSPDQFTASSGSPAPATYRPPRPTAQQQLQLTAQSVIDGAQSPRQFAQNAGSIQSLLSKVARSKETPAGTASFIQQAADTGLEYPSVEFLAQALPLRETTYAGIGLDQRRDDQASTAASDFRVQSGFTPVVVATVLQSPQAQGPDDPAVMHISFRYPRWFQFDMQGTSYDDKQTVESLYYVPRRSSIAAVEALHGEQAMDMNTLQNSVRGLDQQLRKNAMFGIHNEVYHGEYIGEDHADPAVRFSFPGGDRKLDPSPVAATLLITRALQDMR